MQRLQSTDWVSFSPPVLQPMSFYCIFAHELCWALPLWWHNDDKWLHDCPDVVSGLSQSQPHLYTCANSTPYSEVGQTGEDKKLHLPPVHTAHHRLMYIGDGCIEVRTATPSLSYLTVCPSFVSLGLQPQGPFSQLHSWARSQMTLALMISHSFKSKETHAHKRQDGQSIGFVINWCQ